MFHVPTKPNNAEEKKAPPSNSITSKGNERRGTCYILPQEGMKIFVT